MDDFNSFFISDSTKSPISSRRIDLISLRISSRSVRLDDAVFRLSGEMNFSLMCICASWSLSTLNYLGSVQLPVSYRLLLSLEYETES